MQTKKEKSSYDVQAEKFLADTGATIETEFLYHGPHFDDDKDARDVYRITIKRGNPNRSWSFKFGQSIQNSGDKHLRRRKAPGAYNILACVEKHDPGTFSDFCRDFDYSDDSVKAQKLYFAVQEEWINVRRMFGDVLDALAEIA